MAWIFVAWPVTGATWLLFGFERLRSDVRILINGPGPEGSEPVHREIGTGSVV